MRSISSTGRWILAFHPGTGWICFASYEFQAFRNFKNVGHMVSCKYSSCKIGLLISTLLHFELRACRCRSISNLCLSRMIMEAASRAVVLERQYELFISKNHQRKEVLGLHFVTMNQLALQWLL